MSRNAIQITNSALIKLGASPINTFTDGGNATTMRSEFPAIRNLLLAEHVWHFVSTEEILSPLTGESSEDYDYVFQMPANVARVVSVTTGGDANPYDIRGGKIYASFNSINLRYVQSFSSDVTDDAQLYPDSFAHALTCRLAAHVGVNITQNRALTDLNMQEYMLAISQARFSGACERFDQVTSAEEWLDSRNSSLGEVDIGARHTAT